jgi:hypothetical protein
MDVEETEEGMAARGLYREGRATSAAPSPSPSPSSSPAPSPLLRGPLGALLLRHAVAQTVREGPPHP